MRTLARNELNSFNKLKLAKSWNIWIIWDALRDLVPFIQFKIREKHPWSSDTFSKVAGWSIPPWMFFIFFKLYKWYQNCATYHILCIKLYTNICKTLIWSKQEEKEKVSFFGEIISQVDDTKDNFLY